MPNNKIGVNKLSKDTDQSADGDDNIQIGGDGNVAGGNITTTINQGVPPADYAKALAHIQILEEKLAIAQAADKEDPTEEEVLAAGEAMEAAEELEEMGAELDPWNYIKLASAAKLRGRTITAAGYMREALHLFRESGDRQGEAISLNNLGLIADIRGDYDEAERLHNESLAIMREIGDRRGEAYSLENLGIIFSKRGDLDEAERLYNESLAIKREIGDRQGEAAPLGNLGSIADNRGDYDEAERLYRESVRIKNEIGVPLGDWYVENGYTDPDAPWDFPPPERLPAPPAASEEDET